ncbi:MAG: prephenate dehydrogenase [Lachnospiraceae bacterium]|nr:prephenate dehydrogenase [Lachnospiraceae bacterium]
MKVGIVGLGLIGGSFAKAYSKEGHEVCAFDTDEAIFRFAVLSGVVSKELTDEEIPTCDLILICTYPEAAVRYMEEKGPVFGPKPIVIDCCGTKQNVVGHGFECAKKYGFTYIGGHPMAGTQFSGFKYSKENMYHGAPMVLVPEKNDDITFLDRVKQLLMPAGFGSITVTTAETHDKVIAFSSQLAHVVSNAYVKSPSAEIHTGMSAGSYKDMTRVAWLNPEMWTQLFLDNADNLVREIDTLMENLAQYRKAIAEGDRGTLIKLLDEGRKRKEEVDG